MLHIDAQLLAEVLDPISLVDALERAFRSDVEVPPRQHHSIATPDGPSGTLLTMPAWQSGRYIALKIVTVFGSNAARALPTVQGTVLLLDATTGSPIATIDGTELTLRRTAAASALAARYLAREDTQRLLMVGTGQLAPHVIAAHAAVRPIAEVKIWGRDAGKAQRLAAKIAESGLKATAIESLAAATAWADLISCATTATDPLVAGRDLRPGQHLDLIGSFTPRMREADIEAMQRAEVFVDTYTGALAESGELVQALESGAIQRGDILGELRELVRGEVTGRRDPDSITLFKSVGTALEDLAAAELALTRAGRQGGPQSGVRRL
jgi:alanine dehydrogenase